MTQCKREAFGLCCSTWDLFLALRTNEKVGSTKSHNANPNTAPPILVVTSCYAVFGCAYLGLCLFLAAARARDGLVESTVPPHPCCTAQRAVGGGRDSAGLDIVSCQLSGQFCNSLETFQLSPTQGIADATRQHLFATKLGGQRFYDYHSSLHCQEG
jgi:hypothetical protein